MLARYAAACRQRGSYVPHEDEESNILLADGTALLLADGTPILLA